MGIGFFGIYVGWCEPDGSPFPSQAARILDRPDPSDVVQGRRADMELDFGLRVFESEAADGRAVVDLRSGYPGWAVVTDAVARETWERFDARLRELDEKWGSAASGRRRRARATKWLAKVPSPALVLVQVWDKS